jgi:hypothetical protein
VSKDSSSAVLLHVNLRGQAYPLFEHKGDAVAYGIPSPDIASTTRSSNVSLMDNF